MNINIDQIAVVYDVVNHRQVPFNRNTGEKLSKATEIELTTVMRQEKYWKGYNERKFEIQRVETAKLKKEAEKTGGNYEQYTALNKKQVVDCVKHGYMRALNIPACYFIKKLPEKGQWIEGEDKREITLSLGVKDSEYYQKRQATQSQSQENTQCSSPEVGCTENSAVGVKQKVKHSMKNTNILSLIPLKG